MKKIFPGKELILRENHPKIQFPQELTILYAFLDEDGEIVLSCESQGIGGILNVYDYGYYHITPDIQEFLDKVKAAYVPPKKCGDLTLDDLVDLAWIAFKNGEMTDGVDDVKEWAKERNIQLPS